MELAVACGEMWLMVYGSQRVSNASLLEFGVFGSAVDHWECSGSREQSLC